MNMKKKIAGIVLAGALAIGGSAMAATPEATAFGAEQQVSDQWIDTMLVKSQVDDAYGMMSEESRKNIQKDKFQELRAKIAADMGAVKGGRLVSWTRFDQNDQMIYFLSFEKQPVVRCLLVFDKQGKLANFELNPMKAVEKKDAGK